MSTTQFRYDPVFQSLYALNDEGTAYFFVTKIQNKSELREWLAREGYSMDDVTIL